MALVACLQLGDITSASFSPTRSRKALKAANGHSREGGNPCSDIKKWGPRLRGDDVDSASLGAAGEGGAAGAVARPLRDRKSTRLNSSHLVISYAVFCLKKKKR